MSDNFNLLDVEKFKNTVSVGNDHCLKYVCHQSVSSEDIQGVSKVRSDLKLLNF